MLKQWIRKLLMPIPPDQTEAIKAIVHTEMIGELTKLFQVRASWGPVTSVQGLQGYIERAAREEGREAGERAATNALEHIRSEAFIDGVVDRINRKQVGGPK